MPTTDFKTLLPQFTMEKLQKNTEQCGTLTLHHTLFPSVKEKNKAVTILTTQYNENNTEIMEQRASKENF